MPWHIRRNNEPWMKNSKNESSYPRLPGRRVEHQR
jgi:hypothetical protein